MFYVLLCTVQYLEDLAKINCVFLLPLFLSACLFSLQVAIIAGNFELAELIKNHKETDIGK